MTAGFRLTYSTMFSPPPELHTRFDEAMARTLKTLGRRHALYIAGGDRSGSHAAPSRSPSDQDLILGEFAVATPQHANEALQAAQRAWRDWKLTPPSKRAELLRRPELMPSHNTLPIRISRGRVGPVRRGSCHATARSRVRRLAS